MTVKQREPRDAISVIHESANFMAFLSGILLALLGTYLFGTVGVQLAGVPNFDVTYAFALLAMLVAGCIVGGLVTAAMGLARTAVKLASAIWPPRVKVTE